MKPISFFASGVPKAQARPRAFARKFGDKWQARVYNPMSAEGWKSCVAEAARPYVAEMLMEPVSVKIVFMMPRPKNHFNSKGQLKESSPVWHMIKPDGDNLYKGTVDALTTLGLFSDDCIIVHHEVLKIYSLKTGALITVRPMLLSERDKLIYDN